MKSEKCSHAWNFHFLTADCRGCFQTVVQQEKKYERLNEDLYRNYGNKNINGNLHKNSITKTGGN